MKYVIVYTSCWLLCSVLGFSQKPPSPFGLKNNQIHKIELKDTALLRQISDYIQSREKSDSVFSKYGYVVISTVPVSTQKGIMEKSVCLQIAYNYYYFHANTETNRFPLFTTEINNRLVICYDYNYQHEQLSKRVRRKFAKRINATLKPYKPEKIKDETGKIITLQPVGDISLSGGITICN